MSSVRHVAVLFGGISSEHVVSLKTGATMVRGLVRAGFQVTPVVIGLTGTWCLTTPDSVSAGLPAKVEDVLPGAAQTGDALTVAGELIRRGVQVVVIGLHGPGGEDGSLQGFLQTARLPYTGPGVAASAIAMDKLMLKRLMKAAGLPTADWIEFEAEDTTPERFPAAVERARAWSAPGGWPVVVKARTLGSSVGVAIAQDPQGLEKAMTEVARERAGLFIERAIRGVEVSCAAFGSGESTRAFPAIEIVPKKAAWFDFESKYASGGAVERIPAQISPTAEARVRELAIAVHRLIGADGITRTDMIVEGDSPKVLETNTLPGMTETSLVPQEARAIGWSLETLLTRMVENAVSRS